MIDLLTVSRPARYINHEWNAVHKIWQKDFIKIVLCFPDIYEVGMSHLGLKILYGLLNEQADVICERAFAPWPDFEKALRSTGGRLTSLENGVPICEFDIIGFSLQYELNYADVLNILDLGGVPVRRNERDLSHPIVIAGGPCCFNPGPLSDFIDAFVIGEGEEVVLEIVKIFRELGSWRLEVGRDEILSRISEIEGVFVPSKNSHKRIKRRIVRDLDSTYYPVRLIVPYLQIVHDRIPIEIMRGCPYLCKFCQSSAIFRPARERSVENIIRIAKEAIKNTGYEEVSLMSLATSDYSRLDELILKLYETLKDKGVKVSLPSLRINKNKERIPYSLPIIKKSGLTFAPETGREQLRFSLNKRITDRAIIDEINSALASGWRKVKLYFMIGLPKELDQDLDAIIDLSSNFKNVSLSINPFIPKPHTLFEREAMQDISVLKEKQRYLVAYYKSKSTDKFMRLDFHNVEMSVVEAILTRGDEALGKIIYSIWQKGMRLCGWKEQFSFRLWQEAFFECGIEPGSYLRKRLEDEELGWDMIDTSGI